MTDVDDIDVDNVPCSLDVSSRMSVRETKTPVLKYLPPTYLVWWGRGIMESRASHSVIHGSEERSAGPGHSEYSYYVLGFERRTSQTGVSFASSDRVDD